MPTWAMAAFWGLVAGSALLVGAVIITVIGFLAPFVLTKLSA